MHTRNSIVRKTNPNPEAHIFKNYDLILQEDRLNIMMIDDNKKDIQLFEDLLLEESTLKFSLFAWTNAQEALGMLQRHEVAPHIIVLDLVMPSMNGKMVLRYLKGMTETRDIPVVIHSSMNNYENTHAARELDAHAFFSKPLNAPLFENFVIGKEI